MTVAYSAQQTFGFSEENVSLFQERVVVEFLQKQLGCTKKYWQSYLRGDRQKPTYKRSIGVKKNPIDGRIYYTTKAVRAFMRKAVDLIGANMTLENRNVDRVKITFNGVDQKLKSIFLKQGRLARNLTI